MSVNPTLQLATIVNAHLFGGGAVATGSDAPATSMPLILAGVIADPDPAKGVAIIGENAAAGKLYAVGAAIPGGVHLHAVYSDRVAARAQWRPGDADAAAHADVQPAAASAYARGAPRGACRPRPASLLAGLVRVQPLFNQGKLQGYRIFPGGTHGTSAFKSIGPQGRRSDRGGQWHRAR